MYLIIIGLFHMYLIMYYIHLIIPIFLCGATVCRKATFQDTYSNIIYPANGPQLWSLDGQLAVNPPLMRITIGYPKKLRRKTNDEPINPHVLPRNFVTATCHKCEALGHNMRSYKGKRAADRAIPKGENKAKKENPTNTKKKTQTKTKAKKINPITVTEIGSSSHGLPPTQPTQE